MLKTLHIENYALIQNAHIDFDSGFTVITGETGAGKSILLGALGLITGKRADISSIGNSERKCIVEGTFAVDKYALEHFFETHDLDYDPHTIIRRELLPSGKSRAFINDTPVTLQQLTALGDALIDIHSQHKTLEVLHKDYQFDVLDTFAGNSAVLQSYKTQYQRYQEEHKTLELLLEQRTKMKLEQDYNTFLFNELDEARIQADEYEEINERQKILSHSEEIAERLANACSLLSREEIGLLDSLSQLRQELAKLNSYSTDLQEYHDRVNSVYIELEDLSTSLEDHINSTETDPQSLAQLNTRMTLLYDLMQKHQVQTTQELLTVKSVLETKVQGMHTIDDAIAQKEKEINLLKTKLEEHAQLLHANRKKAIPELIKTVEERVQELNIAYAKFDISLTSLGELTTHGIDDLAFLFSANKGQALKLLNKGASGGELSRVMLAIKGILGEHRELPTLVFDEIDTGVSGQVAVKMGAVLKRMSTAMQLLCITHLPQIAGQGRSHFKVTKEVGQSDTRTEITKLNTDDRVEEIAQMLGGVEGGEAVLTHAKNLLKDIY